jgi:hypothetical protein
MENIDKEKNLNDDDSHQIDSSRQNLHDIRKLHMNSNDGQNINPILSPPSSPQKWNNFATIDSDNRSEFQQQEPSSMNEQ